MMYENQPISERKETEPRITFQRPIGVDLFYAGDGSENNLPQSVLEHPRLLKEAAERRELYDSLGSLFAAIPDPRMDISEAMNTGLVSADSVSNVYSQLTNFLETDENNARLILYLPSQILPDRKGKKASEELEESEQKFAEKYKDAWVRLLFESDVRASYVDGDDQKPGVQVRVRKAAHLLPDMVGKGLINLDEVEEIKASITESELVNSLDDGITATRGRATAQGIHREQEPLQEIDVIYSHFRDSLKAADSKYAPNSEYGKTITSKRAIGEKAVEIKKIIEKTANVLATTILDKEVSSTHLLIGGKSEEFAEETQRVGIQTVREIGEAFASTDRRKAEEFTNAALNSLTEIWKSGTPDAKSEVATCLNYWSRLGILDGSRVIGFGIALPDLARPFPVDLQKLSQGEMQPFIQIIDEIRKNPELANYFYSTIILTGSRIKGYSGPASDLGSSIFIKPGVSWEDREMIFRKLSDTVPQVATVGSIKEAWMTEKDGKITFRPIPDGAMTVISARQIQFFLGGVWIETGSESESLREEITQKYLDLERFGSNKEEIRSELLRRVELDMLQYRLMHKGYQRFYPSNRDEGTENAEHIDWDSTFWDPGYRRIASQLFVSRVFLPDLSENRND